MLDKDKTGLIGENFAANYLQKLNYQIIHKRYSLPRYGELDIIATKDRTIYFVEVKTSKSMFDPLDSIRPYKINHLKYSIENYFKTDGKEYLKYSCIIKIIGVKLTANNLLLELNEFDLD